MHVYTGSPKAGVHKSWAGLPGQLNFLQWSLIFLGSLEVVLCPSVGANSSKVAVIFVGNFCTFVIKVTSPRLYLCSVETVLFLTTSHQQKVTVRSYTNCLNCCLLR